MQITKIFIHIVVLFLTISCATRKPNCDAYSKDNFVVTEIDIHIPEYHHHFEKVNRCFWFPATTYVYNDTMYEPKLEYNEIERVKLLVNN